MKVMTVLGTRPEIIRLSRVIGALDGACDHVLAHTGQNHDDRLSGLFFRELGVRAPDETLEIRGDGFADRVGRILSRCATLFRERRPDRLLVLGDTDSALASLVAKRMGIPVYHMEAGNRCYDDRVPEEVNRRVVDHTSSILMPYTERGRGNLLREGIAGDRIFVVGNPMKEVLDHYSGRIEESAALEDNGVKAGGYFLATMHRAENVDIEGRLRNLVDAFAALHARFGLPLLCSLHPRTRSRIEAFGVDVRREGLRFIDPPGFPDFVMLEKHAACVLTDSGTVQEETCILGVPNVTIRDVTERPETLECGSNALAGCDPGQILSHVGRALSAPPRWQPPAEYLRGNVADTVCRIVTSFRTPDPAEALWRKA